MSDDLLLVRPIFDLFNGAEPVLQEQGEEYGEPKLRDDACEQTWLVNADQVGWVIKEHHRDADPNKLLLIWSFLDIPRHSAYLAEIGDADSEGQKHEGQSHC